MEKETFVRWCQRSELWILSKTPKNNACSKVLELKNVLKDMGIVHKISWMYVEFNNFEFTFWKIGKQWQFTNLSQRLTHADSNIIWVFLVPFSVRSLLKESVLERPGSEMTLEPSLTVRLMDWYPCGSLRSYKSVSSWARVISGGRGWPGGEDRANAQIHFTNTWTLAAQFEHLTQTPQCPAARCESAC